jgi:DNA-binding MarR family transcriptional regulator
MEDLKRSWQREYAQLDVSNLPALIRLTRLSAVIDAFQTDLLAPFELTLSDYGVLSTLRRAGRPYALSPSQLYEALGLSSGGMTKILKRLGELELIERIPNPEDRRSIRVRLTARGLSLDDRVFRAMAAASDRALAPLDRDERAEIDRAISRLLGTFEELTSPAEEVPPMHRA